MELGAFEIMLIASTMLEFNPLWQALKIVRRREARSISVWTYLMIMAIGAMWLVYGWRIESLPLIIGNLIKLFASLAVVAVYWRYRPADGRSPL